MTDSSTPNEFDRVTEALAAYACSVEYADLPEDVKALEKDHIVDTIGCILYGSTTPWVNKVIRGLGTIEDTGDSVVFGQDTTLSPASTVLVNGMASHSMDYDDTCRPGVHAGSATIPSACATVRRLDRAVPGEEFLTAITAGVEIGIRSGLGIGRNCVERGFHIAGWSGTFAAAATTGILEGLTQEEMAHALAIAGTQGAGLMGAQYGAEVKRYHMGRAAQSGYLATHFAREGLTGDQRIFGDRYGSIGRTLSGEGQYETDAVIAEIGDEYRMIDSMHLKPFPSIISIHAPVAGVRDILREHDLDPATVQAVTVWTSRASKEHVGWDYEPTGVMSAQGNIQYGIASLLEDGELTINAYTPEAIRRDSVVDRTKSIEILVDETAGEDGSWASKVELTTTDGETYSTIVNAPPGSPNNRFSQDELEGKFRTQATAALPEEKTEKLLEYIRDLEDQSDVSDMFSLVT